MVLESGTEAELRLGDPDVVVLRKRVETGSPLEPDEVELDMLVDDGMEAVLEVLKLKLVVDIGAIAVPDPDEVTLETLVGFPDMDEGMIVLVVLRLGTIVTVLFISLVVVVEVVVRIVDVRIIPLCGWLEILKDPGVYEAELVELEGNAADEVAIDNILVPKDVILRLTEERGPVGVDDMLKFPVEDEEPGVIIAVAVSVVFVKIVTVLLFSVEIVVVLVVRTVEITLEVTIGTPLALEKDVSGLVEDSDEGRVEGDVELAEVRDFCGVERAEDKVKLPTLIVEVGVRIVVAVSVMFETLVTVLLFCMVDVVRVVVLTVIVVVGLRMLPLSGCPDMLKDPE